MTFLNPAALWWLFLLLPLAALYLLKVRPERHQTTLLFLWEKVFEKKHSAAVFKRLRNWLSLLLLAIAYTAVVLALAKPCFYQINKHRKLIIIIDSSASMNTLQNGKTLFDRARTKAAAIIKNLLPSQQAVLAAVSTDLRIITGASSNQHYLLKALEQLRPTECAMNPDALSFLAKHRDFCPGSRAILLTDGCFRGASKLKAVEMIRLGKPKQNAGIVGFDIIRLQSGKNNEAGIFISCASTYPDNSEVDLVLAHGKIENIVKVFPLKLKKGINKPIILKIENAAAGKWFAILDKAESFALDNVTCAVLREPQPVKTAISASTSIYEMLVNAYRHSKIMELTDKTPEIVICEGNVPENIAAEKYIIFKPENNSIFWKGAGRPQSPQHAVVEKPAHQLVKFCRLDEAKFEEIQELTPPANSVIVASTANGQPLIYKTARNGKTAYVFNFDPMRGDFFLQVDFPVLLGAAVMDLCGKTPQLPAVFKTGSLLPEAVAATFNGGSMLLPNRKIVKYTPDKHLVLPGFYTLMKNGQRLQFAAALLSVPDTLPPRPEFKSTAQPLESGIPVSFILLATALVLVTLEEILYNRRKVG
ncbi:VWA domain-containing protein [Lentisphaerota bacterium ZTH]|nr:VWA domain-containing protein [Lentisphaerota bacterium]WET05985.1 VWA domain-containing protein [Lentisphaerota bacterium ZTH]